jgi:MFS family permease
MVDMRMLAHRPVLLTNIATMISGFALFSCFVLLPSFVETSSDHGYGFDASATQSRLVPASQLDRDVFAGPLAGTIGRHIGSKWPLAGGMLIVSIAALLFATTHDEPLPCSSPARCSASVSVQRSPRWQP